MAVLTEEQVMLKDMAVSWARDHAPVGVFRKLREEGRTADPFVYREMAEMGWTGVIVPEAYGGSDFGFLSLGVVIEELGRHLVASPLIGTALGGASALVLGGNAAQQERWLPAIATGELIVALAFDEGAHHRPHAIALTAMRDGAGWRLDGVKRPVFDGMAAGLAIVSAHTDQGIALFLVETSAGGLTRMALDQIDARDAAEYRFAGVTVGADAMLGDAALLDGILDRVRAGLAAEMLGSALQAYEVTLDYLKTRVQFGQIIGSFQALQHRAVEMYGELQFARSTVEAALAAIDAGTPDIAELASLAKATAGDALHLISNEMVQMHAGIGMTDEHDAGLYLKRARVLEAAFGNAAFHRERFGRLAGY